MSEATDTLKVLLGADASVYLRETCRIIRSQCETIATSKYEAAWCVVKPSTLRVKRRFGSIYFHDSRVDDKEKTQEENKG